VAHLEWGRMRVARESGEQERIVSERALVAAPLVPLGSGESSKGRSRSAGGFRKLADRCAGSSGNLLRLRRGGIDPGMGWTRSVQRKVRPQNCAD
jgi:hypothetical protein